MTPQERADDAVRGLADQYAIDARLGLRLISRVREAIEAAVAVRTEEIIALADELEATYETSEPAVDARGRSGRAVEGHMFADAIRSKYLSPQDTGGAAC